MSQHPGSKGPKAAMPRKRMTVSQQMKARADYLKQVAALRRGH